MSPCLPCSSSHCHPAASEGAPCLCRGGVRTGGLGGAVSLEMMPPGGGPSQAHSLLPFFSLFTRQLLQSTYPGLSRWKPGSLEELSLFLTLVTLSADSAPGPDLQLCRVLCFVRMVTGVIPTMFTTEPCPGGAQTLGGVFVCVSVCTWARCEPEPCEQAWALCA